MFNNDLAEIILAIGLSVGIAAFLSMIGVAFFFWAKKRD